MEDKQRRIIKGLIRRADTKIEIDRGSYLIKLKMLGGIVLYRSYSYGNEKDARTKGNQHLERIKREELDHSDVTFRDELKFLEWYSKYHRIS